MWNPLSGALGVGKTGDGAGTGEVILGKMFSLMTTFLAWDVVRGMLAILIAGYLIVLIVQQLQKYWGHR